MKIVPRAWILGAGAAAVVLAVYVAIWMTPTVDLARIYSGSIGKASFEDGIVESAGALLFFLTGLLFIAAYVSSSGNRLLRVKTKRNVFLLLLALVFFFGAGEEVSWGQRIFGLETPEWFEEHNQQREISIHNLSIFHGKDAAKQRKTGFAAFLGMDRLFSLFWFGFCVVLPLAALASGSIRRLVKSINIPVPPLWAAAVFPLNYVLSKAAVSAQLHPGLDIFVDPVPVQAQFPGVKIENMYGHLIVETKEALFAFLFCVLAYYFWVSIGKSREGRVAAGDGHSA